MPVDAQVIIFAPNCLALVTATVIPRSLKDAVGLSPSFLICNVSIPRKLESFLEVCNLVPPSLSVTRSTPAGIGKKS